MPGGVGLGRVMPGAGHAGRVREGGRCGILRRPPYFFGDIAQFVLQARLFPEKR